MLNKPNSIQNESYIKGLRTILSIHKYNDEQPAFLMNTVTWENIIKIPGIPYTPGSNKMFTLFGVSVLITKYIPDQIIGMADYRAALYLSILTNKYVIEGKELELKLDKEHDSSLFINDDIQYIDLNIFEILNNKIFKSPKFIVKDASDF